MRKFLLFATTLMSCGMVLADGSEVISDVDTALVDATGSANSGWKAYFGLGFGGSFLENKCDVDGDDIHIDKQTVNRFMGTVTLGVGRFFENGAYCGLEFLTDFGKSVTKDVQSNGNGVYKAPHIGAPAPLGVDIELRGKVKNTGCYPELALKFGYKYNCCLLYAKIGGRYSKVTYDLSAKVTNGGTAANPIAPAQVANLSYNKSKSNVVPTIALGAEYEKGKFGLFGEVEYSFRQKNDNEVFDCKFNTKCNEGWIVRAGASYAVSF